MTAEEMFKEFRYKNYAIILFDNILKLCYPYAFKTIIMSLESTKENYYKCLDKMIELWRNE